MWLLPSRGRPAACQALLDSMVAHGMTALGVLLLTETDSCRAEYEAIALPEGWFREIVCQTLKIDPKDDFGLLIQACGDCIGAVWIKL